MNLVFAGSPRDTKYLRSVSKGFAYFSKVFPQAKRYGTFTELKFDCKKYKADFVATTSLRTLKFFDPFLEGTQDENRGYVAERDGIKCVLIPDLSHVWSTNTGKFLIQHYLQKLAHPERFIAVPTFRYDELKGDKIESGLAFLSSCHLMAVDIETARDGLVITSCAFTGLNDSGVCRSFVIDFRNTFGDELMFRFALLRKVLATKAAKIMQRGIYDASYFARFGCDMRNYLFDTYVMAHCIFPELKKELEFLTLFYTTGARFWKDESGSDLLKYNAKDTHYTLWTWIGMMHYAKKHAKYALENYKIQFPLVFPCILCGLEGLAVDEEESQRLRELEVKRYDRAIASLETLTGLPGINPKSPKQMKQLLQAVNFGAKKIEKTDAASLADFADSHILHERISDAITECREASKAISTYYDFERLGGRLLYELDPSGTETGRSASKKSAFWCGSQIQNQPGYAKSQYVSDPGWLFGACDAAQAESRCTAYLAEDLALIKSVEESPDFHCTNASLFFGIPFDQLYDISQNIVLNKPIRTLAKRVNHGANYNMGWYVLFTTMGRKNVFKAAHLLGLLSSWGIKQICTHLLNCFDRAYPRVRNEFQTSVVKEIEFTGKLRGPTGWTRRTFLRPRTSKPDLNAAVAHGPQSLNVMLINKGFMKIFRHQIQNKSRTIRLKAQIHDDILYQHPIGGEAIAQFVSDSLRIPCKIKGRTMVIPNDPIYGAKNWAELKD